MGFPESFADTLCIILWLMHHAWARIESCVVIERNATARVLAHGVTSDQFTRFDNKQSNHKEAKTVVSSWGFGHLLHMYRSKRGSWLHAVDWRIHITHLINLLEFVAPESQSMLLRRNHLVSEQKAASQLLKLSSILFPCRSDVSFIVVHTLEQCGVPGPNG